MIIPKGTEGGYYWVKFATKWHPALVWKSVHWCFAVAGFSTVYKEKDIGELGPRMKCPSESIGESAPPLFNKNDFVMFDPDDWIKLEGGEVQFSNARYAKMKESERIVNSIQELVKKSMEVYIGYAEEFGMDKREGWTLAVNKIIITQYAAELGDLFVEEKA